MPVRQQTSREHELGQYMTRPDVADLMAAEATASDLRCVLDPAAGHGELLDATIRRANDLGVESPRLIGYDIDTGMVESSRRRLPSSASISHRDFLSGRLPEPAPSFIIANPPYGAGREAAFFEHAARSASAGTLIVFLMPLSFVDRVDGVRSTPLKGRPLGVTTGHAIITHRAGAPYTIEGTRTRHATTGEFAVLTGLKAYEHGSGTPPQTSAIVATKPYTSDNPMDGWLPYLRTGDVTASGIALGRHWIDYGPHLASPKEPERFEGPRLVVRRVPLWRERRLCARYIDVPAAAAGDLLIIKHRTDDVLRLQQLADWLGSETATALLHDHRPSVALRDSFPKVSAKDVNWLIQQAEHKSAL